MKNLFNTAVIIAIVATPVMNACSNAPEGDKATITAEQRASEAKGTRFTVDTAASRIRFTGHGVGKNHPGTFRLSGGNVSVAGNDITAGDFIINIQSLELEQKGEMFDKKLRPHLMSGDFFDANKFRTARFEITGVQPYRPSEKDTSIVGGANYLVSGNFTLRDVTKNITFPARIDLDDNTLRAKGNFDIDRTEWKMNYGNDKTLGDKFISEKVNIELDLQARRQ
ncbi:MAG TPA: YceI family protein [Flavisolibacter sp.]